MIWPKGPSSFLRGTLEVCKQTGRSSPAASLRNVKYFQVALSRSEADSWCVDHGETALPFLGSVVGGSVGVRGPALTCCVAFVVLPELCTLTLLYCAAFIQIFLSSSQENTKS